MYFKMPIKMIWTRDPSGKRYIIFEGKGYTITWFILTINTIIRLEWSNQRVVLVWENLNITTCHVFSPNMGSEAECITFLPFLICYQLTHCKFYHWSEKSPRWKLYSWKQYEMYLLRVAFFCFKSYRWNDANGVINF